jgi:hypothetical protein
VQTSLKDTAFLEDFMSKSHLIKTNKSVFIPRTTGVLVVVISTVVRRRAVVWRDGRILQLLTVSSLQARHGANRRSVGVLRLLS